MGFLALDVMGMSVVYNVTGFLRSTNVARD